MMPLPASWSAAHVSYALRAGLAEAKEHIKGTFDLMEKRFWSREHGLYADEATGDWKTLFQYRGQNANMHGCEALITAFEATGEVSYLERALLIARNWLRYCKASNAWALDIGTPAAYCCRSSPMARRLPGGAKRVASILSESSSNYFQAIAFIDLTVSHTRVIPTGSN
jgi:N-acylglucosamine 2-epimerase (GlcNAc 2-epimerase)